MSIGSKIRIKAAFYCPIEARATPAPTSKSLEELEFVVDCGASMHVLNKNDLNSADMETLRRSRIPTTVVTADGEVPTSEEAQVHVHDLDLFVTVQLLDDTPAGLSRMYLPVGPTSVDPTREEHIMQNCQAKCDIVLLKTQSLRNVHAVYQCPR